MGRRRRDKKKRKRKMRGDFDWVAVAREKFFGRFAEVFSLQKSYGLLGRNPHEKKKKVLGKTLFQEFT